MWILLVVILTISPTGPEVKHVHITGTFETKKQCLKYMNKTPSNEIPPLHNLGCIKFGGQVV
jgi:hypothetical protein